MLCCYVRRNERCTFIVPKHFLDHVASWRSFILHLTTYKLSFCAQMIGINSIIFDRVNPSGALSSPSQMVCCDARRNAIILLLCLKTNCCMIGTGWRISFLHLPAFTASPYQMGKCSEPISSFCRQSQPSGTLSPWQTVCYDIRRNDHCF